MSVEEQLVVFTAKASEGSRERKNKNVGVFNAFEWTFFHRKQGKVLFHKGCLEEFYCPTLEYFIKF